MAGMCQGKEVITQGEGREILKKLRKLGAKSIVITSVKTEAGDFVLIYDHQTDTVSELPFETDSGSLSRNRRYILAISRKPGAEWNSA